MATQGRLAYEVASRPLLAEDLHAEAVVIEIIARSGEFVATWGPIDAPDFSPSTLREHICSLVCVSKTTTLG